MKIIPSAFLPALLLLASLPNSGFAQGNNVPPGKNIPTSEWKFEGGQWQFQDGGAVLPPQQNPGIGKPQPPGGTPVYPPSNPYPPTSPGNTPVNPGPKPTPNYPGPTPINPPTYTPSVPLYSPPLVKIQIGKQAMVVIGYPNKYPSTSAGLVVVPSSLPWIVRYKKNVSEPWHHYAVYNSSNAAFTAATSLSNSGFWAAVVRK